MFTLSQVRMKRLVAIHGWSGTLLGLLLYVVLLSGAVVVFAHEIGTWSVGGAKSHEPLAAPLDGTLRQLAEQVDPEYLDEISLFHNAAGHVIAFFHTHTMNDRGQPDDLGVMLELDPHSHQVLSQREGFGSDLFRNDPAGALDEFLVDLHVNLTAPDPWGLYLTGILGLMMMMAAVSGLLIHRHLIKDLFVAPRPSSRLLTARDRHNLAASWGLPFAFILAFTGSFLSFAIALGLPTLSAVAFGGNQMAMFEAFIGVPQAEDSTPAPLADLDAMLHQSAATAGSTPEFVVVSHFGRMDARVSVFHPPRDGALNGTQHIFDGVDGSFLGPKPDLGTRPSAGNTAFGLIQPLHFGTFSGLLSRVIWFSLGLAMCYVTLTGMLLWLRRREASPLWRRLARCVPVVGYGLPLALGGSGIGYFLSAPAGSTLWWTPAGFVIVAVAAIVLGLAVRRDEHLDRLYQYALAAVLIALPLLRLLSGGTGWIDAIAGDNALVVSFDLVLLIFGAGFAWAGSGRTLPHFQPRVLGQTRTAVEP